MSIPYQPSPQQRPACAHLAGSSPESSEQPQNTQQDYRMLPNPVPKVTTQVTRAEESQGEWSVLSMSRNPAVPARLGRRSTTTKIPKSKGSIEQSALLPHARAITLGVGTTESGLRALEKKTFPQHPRSHSHCEVETTLGPRFRLGSQRVSV